MRAPLIALLAVLLVNAAVDYYIYRQTSRHCHGKIWRQAHSYSAVILSVAMIVAICLPAQRGSTPLLLAKMWLLFSYLSVYVPKYIAVLFDMLANLPCLWKRQRIKHLTFIGMAIAMASFAAMWWGALVNRFKIDVTEVEIEMPSLPQGLEGLTIAQFSDLHTGTFGTDTAYVSHLVDAINALQADAIVFTGDIVNRSSDEITPFVQTLARLHAPMGTYAILGNHDYGDYQRWSSHAEKNANMELLFDAYRRTGIRLLRNETAWLRAGNDSIALIGVENIGDPPFRTYGSLRKAYPTTDDAHAKILLTHNPQHWVDSISGQPDMNIGLTLSGHTHAMQIELGGISPAALRYRTWGGLYTDTGHHHQLYVNIGAGTVGLPMRIGATPEITLITLHRAK